MTREEAKHFSDVLKAYSEGKEIEHLRTDGVWDCICKDPTFTESPMHYRIKSTPKLRPYKNAEEFLKAQKEHGPYITIVPSDSQKKYQRWYLPTLVENNIINLVYTVNNPRTGEEECNGIKEEYRELLTNFIWQDGAPCGIYE